MQLNKLKNIVANAWQIPVFRDFYTKNNAPLKINSKDDLQKLPLLNKELYYQLTKKKPLELGKNIYVFKAMVDLEGHEAVFPLSATDYQNYIALEKRKFELLGVKKTDLCSVVAFSQNHTIPLAQAFLALGASYIPLDGDEEKIFRNLIEQKVTVIFTIPPVVYRLLDYVKTRQLKTSLRLIITTGVKIPNVEELSEQTKQILGASLLDTIGATELASFAFSCPEHPNFYHFVDQQQIVEILNPQSQKASKSGEIVITPLWKEDFPLLRYATGDFTKINEKLTCSCRLQSKLLISGVEKRLSQATRVQRYLLDFDDFYYKVRERLLWQYFFDSKLWNFLEKPALVILLDSINHADRVLVFIEKQKFHLTLRKREVIERNIFQMTNADVKIVLCDKSMIQKIKFSHRDIRGLKRKSLPKEVLALLNLC